ncbi:hypothetical protein ABQZ69_13555 [Xanthomonas sp. WHRI 8391]|uniref:DUF3077 domain-containing protein n=2 Tax=Xanthomonas hortorum TaxID=56454 RepID=A0A6V7FB06_9XANT|nr:hypothetical protein [Xanthomonas hortorum]ETC89257.1 hypothetical protein XHC_1214 [Xanthomonas hortorum pv. carotae str. M081]MBG3850970.1 hypothetical protein [Xanthomonas hortorum pv. carotae]UTS71310.1 hypothetical protein NMB96_12125 [Xanthomonas hortorum]WAH63305.1 hypothetical protein OEG85_17765 [Xanthomonas hortorum]CAD0360620.1 hypothetical protein CFBP7900_32620 [Xanthomonas hortorum pv. carotae]
MSRPVMASPRARRRAGDDKPLEAFAFGITVEQVDALDQLLLTIAAHGDVIAAGNADRLDRRTLPVLGSAIFDAAGAMRTILDQLALQRL